MIHTCSTCGQQNRVPEKYKGIPVCARCKTQLFETVLTSSETQKRSRWTRRNLTIAVLLSMPVHWFLVHQWVWSLIVNFVSTVTVCLLVITTLVGIWLVIWIGFKVGWEEIWATRRLRKQNPPVREEPYLDLGPWDVATDYLDLARQRWQRFALRKERA